MAMNQAIKAKWVAALRSNKYKQACGGLRPTEDSFCVLGVLCNLHAQAHPEIAKKQTKTCTYMGSDSFLPKGVFRWAGLNGGAPYIGKGLAQRSLVRLNDGIKLSFKELAAAIEFSDL